MKVTFFAFRVPRDKLELVEFYGQDLKILRELGHDVTIATTLREVDPKSDVVFVWWWNWLWLSGPWLKILGLPTVVTGTLDPVSYAGRSAWQQWLIRQGMRFADYSVFVSQYMKDEITAVMPVRNPNYCPHIVTGEYHLANPANAGRDPHLILNIAWKRRANMVRKMVPELVEAFALVRKEIPAARLILAGEPEDGQQDLERRVKELGLEAAVEFRGRISKEEKIGLMQTCGAYYQCSRSEGFGLALAESMACGSPVIVNRCTAIPEVVGDAGYYVTATTPAAIAGCLLGVLRNPDGARATGLAASRRIDELYRWDRRRNFFRDLLVEAARLKRK